MNRKRPSRFGGTLIADLAVDRVAPKITYRDAIAQAMTDLAADPRRRFIGYGMLKGGAMGTLKGVPREQLVEMPVAENLMMGAAIGMSLAGLLPVVYFERFDFVLNAADAIVNHLSAAEEISGGEFRPAVIIRVTVGNSRKPLFTGRTHTQNLSQAFREMGVLVFEPMDAELVRRDYALAAAMQALGRSAMIVERKDLL